MSPPHPTATQAPTILAMAAPLVVSFWMRAAVTFVDTIYASLIGDAAVAAIGLTIPLEFLMIALWVGLSSGLTSRLSRAMGERQDAKVRQYLSAGWKMVLVVSPLFTLVGAAVWFAAPSMNLEPEVRRSLQIYGTTLIGGSAFTTFWSILPDSIVKAHQDTRSTMWAGIWSNLINVGLNTLFLFVFQWGLFGIALSTVLGRIGGLAYAIARARHHEARRAREVPAWGRERDPAPYRAILDLSIPSSITFGLMAAETGILNWLLSHTAHPTESIAAYSIYYRFVLFALQPVIATSVALLPFAARRLGAGDICGVRRGLRQAHLAATVYALAILGPCVVPLAPWIAARLSESPATREYATFAIAAVPFACLAGAPFLLCRPVFEALGRGRPGLVMAIVRYLALTPPLAAAGVWLARRWVWPGLHGLIVATLVAAALASAAFLVWLRAALDPARGRDGRPPPPPGGRA